MYIPILKTKAGEFQALKELTPSVRKKVLPLFEATNVQWDYTAEAPSSTLEVHLNKLVGNFTLNYGDEHEVLLDLPDVLHEAEAGGKHAMTYLFETAAQNDLKLIPALGLNRPTSYTEAVKTIAETDQRGIALRLDAADLTDQSSNDSIEKLLSSVGVSPNQAHLILDFKSIVAGQEQVIFLAFSKIIASLPYIEDWKSVTFAATSFPKDLTGFSADTISKIPRTEWSVWNLINTHAAEFPVTIGFGDYTISHPEIVEIDPRIMTMSASIRYTGENNWLILKARGVKKHGFGQFTALSQELVKMPEYRGKTFSKGDEIISDCADGSTGTGNAQTWRKVGVNHHLATAVDQLSRADVL